MIRQVEGTINGFHVDETTTLQDIKDIFKDYGSVRSIIVNLNMYKSIKSKLTYSNNITVNRNIPDNVFYVNCVR